MCPPTGFTHELPSYTALRSFIQPGISLQQDILNILRFLQLCSRCARLAQSEREREGETEGWKSSQWINEKKIQLLVHIHVFPLFSSCQLACLFISTLLHPQGDGWLGLPWLMPKGYGANGPAVLRGLWQAAVPPHWFWPNLNGMFLWWVLSGLVSVSYSPSWSKLSPMPKNKERHSLENHSEDHLALTSGESQEFLSHTVESEKKFSFFCCCCFYHTDLISLEICKNTHARVYTQTSTVPTLLHSP